MIIEKSIKNKILSGLDKIKDGGIFLGIIYGITFILLLPIYVKYNDGAMTLITLSLYSLVCIAIVNVFFNWMYYLIITIPVLFSSFLFVLGWSLYVMTPLFIGVIVFLFDVINNAFSLFFIFEMMSIKIDTNWISHISRFIEHLGQFFIAIGGLFWWFVKKGESINYKALSIYLVFLVFIGMQFGIAGLQNIFYFLFIWLLLYLKVSNIENFKDNVKGIKIMFKLGATLVALSGFASVSIVGTGLNAKVFFNVAAKSGLFFNFYSIYQNVFIGMLLLGIWLPKNIIKNIVPLAIRSKINVIYGILQNKSYMFQLKL